MWFEKLLLEVSLGVLVFAVGWALVAQRLFRDTAKKQPVREGLEAALLPGESKVLVKSRVPLALRQLVFYAAVGYYSISASVYLARYIKGKGPHEENSERLLRCAAALARAGAWLWALRADAFEYKSSKRTRNTPMMLLFVCAAAAGAAVEAKRKDIGDVRLDAPNVWALWSHGLYFLVALHAALAKHLILRVATDEEPRSPEEAALELHEIVGFAWLDGVFGVKRSQAKDEKLDETHLPALMYGDRVGQTWPKLRALVAAMQAEKISEGSASVPAEKGSKTLRLFMLLVSVTRAHFTCAGIFRFFYVFTGYLQPLALYIILKRFGKDDAMGWAAVGMLFFGPVVNTALDNMQMFMQRRVATRCRGALMVLLYEKGSRLDMAAGTGRVGEVVALMSADVQNVLNALAYAHWTWAPLLQLAVTLTALFWLVKLAAFGALGVMALNSIANGQIFKRLTGLNKRFLAARSKRMELITEMLQGARIVKMLAFEGGLARSIAERRGVELGVLRMLLNCFVGIFTLINSTPPLMGAATFFLMASVFNKRFDAAEGFTALTLLDNLRFVLLQAPASINYIITGWASLQRIEEFLDAPETDQPPKSTEIPTGSVDLADADFKWGGLEDDDDEDKAADTRSTDGRSSIGENKADGDHVALLENGAEATAEPLVKLTLRNITLDVAPGQLLLVCGITGGGKSSLLAALNGEIRRLRGSVRVSGATAYCPQAAWCQNATIRENICFGSEFDEERFAHCIETCALGADLDSLPAGDQTEVGERGVTLSGGQQQRVALARAVYHEADVYILDDPLSAVDAHVGEHLFQRVIKDTILKRGKTVVLATHQISLALGRADKIVILAQDGSIAAQGTPESIQATPRGRVLFSELVELEASQGGDKKKKKKGAGGEKAEASADKEANAKSKGGGHQLVKEEERKTGAPAFKLFSLYVSSAGWWFSCGAMLFILQQPIRYVQSAALTKWINRMSHGARPLAGMSVWMYLIWTAAFVGLSFVAIVCQNIGALRASKVLHESLAWRVLRMPISWYDRTPVGRAQNRFSTDVQAIDRSVSNSVIFLIRGLVSPLVSLYAIGSEVPWLLPCFIPMLAAAFHVANSYLMVARDLKRIDSTTKSPVYACFNESLNGLSTLRAFDGAFDRFKNRFARLVDKTNSAELHLFATNFWLSVRLNTLGASVTGLTGLVLYAQSQGGHGMKPAFAGLVLSYAVSFTSAMIMLLRTYTDLEQSLNSVERVNEYLDLPIEPELVLPDDEPQWLVTTPGEVKFENVTLRYASQPEPALKSLTLTARPGESLGICGRTGAGKSTLLQSLLRLYPLEDGRVVIDGVDTHSVGLKTLRSRIAIVPQEPTLFAGTVRMNLDMFGDRTDEELLDALEQSRGGGLVSKSSSQNLLHHNTSANSLNSLSDGDAGETVAELSLDFQLHEFGTNLSLGERQLLCLARAIARKSRLVLMDEATANVDSKTDRRIQEILRTGSLSKATRITIAHRLGTIIYCNRVCVLSHGELKELDSPANLLNDKSSMFYSMCDAQGNVDALKATAIKADRERQENQ